MPPDRFTASRPLRLAVVVMFLGVTSASAGSPLHVCSSGQPFLWPSGGRNIPFNPDRGDLGPLLNAEAVAEVEEAFQVWGSIASSTLGYSDAGPLPFDVDIDTFAPFLFPTAADGLSAVVFDDTGEIFDLLFGRRSGILGFAGPEWLDPATCEITEAVSFLNGPAFEDADEARDVMIHEFGHYSNFDHSVVNGQIRAGDTSGPSPNETFGSPDFGDDIVETMHPFYFGHSYGVGTLHRDDIRIASAMYPADDFLATTGTVSGFVLAPNGTTRLSGVNVIARNIADPFNDAASAISGDFTTSQSQDDPLVGGYTLRGLTPGAEYAVFVDEIEDGEFSAPVRSPLPEAEEFYNGDDESSDADIDDPAVFTAVTAAAGGTVGGVDILFNTPPNPLALEDDDAQELFLPFRFTLCGQTFESVYVNSNGTLTFGGGNTDYDPTAEKFLAGPPTIAPLWNDLNPAAGGSVFWSIDDLGFTARYEDVPEYFAFGSNTFEVSLVDQLDLVQVDYDGLSAETGIAGISCGGAITSGFETPSNLSRGARKQWVIYEDAAVYEQFDDSRSLDLGDRMLNYFGTASYSDTWAEPNDDPGSAHRIGLPFDSVPVSRYSEIKPTGDDVDFYHFRAKAGTSLVAEIIGGQLDSVIGLFDGEGTLLAIDDDGGDDLLSRLVYRIPITGRYLLAVTTWNDFDFDGNGVDGGRYVIEVKTVKQDLQALGKLD